MPQPINIIGAGMAGLLAARLLRNHSVTVLERQKELPHNHTALLRFRTHAIADVTGIEFRSVKINKSFLPWRNPVADALAYSFKCLGVRRSDRSISDLEPVAERYIAPDDFIERLAETAKIQFSVDWDIRKRNAGVPVISTLPMPLMMKMLEYSDYQHPKFKHVVGFNLRAKLKQCDAYVSIYVPSPDYGFNRISITGDQLVVEYAMPGASLDDVEETLKRMDAVREAEKAFDILGMTYLDWVGSRPSFHKQAYAKIMPIENDVRKDFIHWATVTHNIYSLGRFATWRPGLLLDDLVKDIQLIEKWISKKNKYDVSLYHRRTG